jgi:hypothetical protein
MVCLDEVLPNWSTAIPIDVGTLNIGPPGVMFTLRTVQFLVVNFVTFQDEILRLLLGLATDELKGICNGAVVGVAWAECDRASGLWCHMYYLQPALVA